MSKCWGGAVVSVWQNIVAPLYESSGHLYCGRKAVSGECALPPGRSAGGSDLRRPIMTSTQVTI